MSDLLAEAVHNEEERRKRERNTPDCLLPDDDTAVERLAAALDEAGIANRSLVGPEFPNVAEQWAERIIERLREGGQR